MYSGFHFMELKVLQHPHQWLGKVALALVLANLSVCQSVDAAQIRPRVMPQVRQLRAIASPSNTHTARLETYESQVIGAQRQYGIILPPDYAQNPQQRYPVIFLLHGGNGGPADWLIAEKGDIEATLRRLYAQGKLPPSIVVTPDGNDVGGFSQDSDPEYINGPHGAIAAAIGDELVQVIQQRYRTLPCPDFWAIGGLSSGGWGAINVGLHYPNHFAVLFSHSGYFVDKSGAENSPLQGIKTLPIKNLQRLKIYLDSGLSDPHYLKQATKFDQTLADLGVFHLLRAFPGDHGWAYWRQHVADSLAFVGEQFHQEQIATATITSATGSSKP